MVALGGGHWPSARTSAELRRHPSRHALCRAGLRRFRFHALASRSGGLFPDRAILEKADRPAHGSLAAILSVAIKRPRLFHRPPNASPRRRRLRSRLGREART